MASPHHHCRARPGSPRINGGGWIAGSSPAMTAWEVYGSFAWPVGIGRRIALLGALAGVAAVMALGPTAHAQSGQPKPGQPQSDQSQANFRPTAQDRADLARVETYLNGMRTLKAQFLQVAPDGGLSRGTAWLERPGHMRFQYDPPAPFLLVANHGLLMFHDSSLRQTSNIPLSRTPLGMLLAERATLSGDVTVTGVQRLPGQLQVSLVRTNNPGEGTLTLIFADNPLALRQWTVLDAQRKETRVTLHGIDLGGRFDPKLFEFVEPVPFQGGGGG